MFNRLPVNPEQLLGWVVPDVSACREAAMQLVAASPSGRSVDHLRLAQEVINSARRRAAAIGGATGMAASPMTMIPAAVADIAAVLKIEGTMAGTVAALLDPASLDDPDKFAADVITVVFPGAVSQALRQVGIRAGEELTKNFVRKVAGRESVQAILKVVAKLMGWRVGERALLGKDVPIVGIGIGLGWNWLEVGAVGKRAVAYYTGQPIGRKNWGERVKQVLPERMVTKVWRSATKPPPPLPPIPPALPGPGDNGEG